VANQIQAVDEAGAAALLAERLGAGVTDVTAFERQGEWSRAFAFRHQGRDLVARFSALAEDFERDRLASLYHGPSLPVPRVLALDEAPGGYVCISERLFGTFLDDLDEAQMRALLPALFAMLDAMRLAEVSDTTGYCGWDAHGQGTFPSWQAAMLDVAVSRPNGRNAGWREKLEASPTGAEPFDRAFERLQTLVPGLPESRHLVHSDLLHYNVLVQDDRISAVLDWGCGMYGDFLFDVAWICFWAPWYPAWNGIDFRAEARRHYQLIGLDVPRFGERLLAYELYIGLAGQAYQAFKGYWKELDETARHTLRLAGLTTP
jgi:hygromycin-B 4-O-kinase